MRTELSEEAVAEWFYYIKQITYNVEIPYILTIITLCGCLLTEFSKEWVRTKTDKTSRVKCLWHGCTSTSIKTVVWLYNTKTQTGLGVSISEINNELCVKRCRHNYHNNNWYIINIIAAPEKLHFLEFEQRLKGEVHGHIRQYLLSSIKELRSEKLETRVGVS